jgi:putative membrane protein
MRGSWLIFALIAAAAALLPPMHDLAHDSFAWHMVQHLILIFIVSSALAFGMPRVTWLGAVAGPILVIILNAVALWGWHLPVLYDAALENPLLHALEHASFVTTGVLFWGVIGERFGPVDYLKRAGVVFAVGLQSAALGALLVFASDSLYESHHSGPGGLTPLEDQQLAGGIMWIPPGIVYLIVTLVLLARWIDPSKRASVEGEPS